MAAVSAVLALVMSSCAIPTQSGPSTISPTHVPFGLLSPKPPPTTTTQPRLTSFVPVKVFFLAEPDGQLQDEGRVVYSPAPLSSIIKALLAGPTVHETAKGIFTEIPSDVTLLGITTGVNTVTVNFNAAFGHISGSATEEAVGQVVATIATQDGFSTGVIFEIDGERTNVPIASGAQLPGPVYLLQFLASRS
jgi:spore germination protein GerM